MVTRMRLNVTLYVQCPSSCFFFVSMPKKIHKRTLIRFHTIAAVTFYVYCSFSLSGIDSSSIARVEEFKYLGTTLTDQNSIQEEIKSRLKLGNACYYSVQSLLSSRLLSKNLKIQIYRVFHDFRA